MKKIPVVFACDDNYAMAFAVAVESLLANKADNTFYDIYCLIPEALSSDNLAKIKQLDLKYTNFKLTYIAPDEQLKDIEMPVGHLSYVTYYRLFVPELLHDYEKVLYLDVDLIIKSDLSLLFDTDLENCYLGAIKHPDLHKLTQVGRYSIPPDSYFNAGVLLMNLGLIRKDNKQREFISLINEEFSSFDQDILNVSCSGKVKYLDMKYNMMTKLCYFVIRFMTMFINRKELKSARKNPSIIHYADREKPWDYANLPYNTIWDENYKTSAFYDAKILENRKSLNYFVHNIILFHGQIRNVYLYSIIEKSLLKISILNKLKKKIINNR